MSLFEIFGIVGSGTGLYVGAVFGAHHGAVGRVLGAVIGVPVGFIAGIGFTLFIILLAHLECKLRGYVRSARTKDGEALPSSEKRKTDE